MREYPANPFGPAISEYTEMLTNLNFKPPYLPSIVHLIVIIFVLLLLVVFYLTIGMATQIWNLLWGAAVDSFQNVQQADSLVEPFSHGVASGTFTLVSLPFAIIMLPAIIVGGIMNALRSL
jgi:hypothetical protein